MFPSRRFQVNGNQVQLVISWLILMWLPSLFSLKAEFRQANTSLKLPPNLPGSQYQVTDALPGLAFEKPVVILSPPGETNRLFVVEQVGRILVITNLSAPDLTLFMDLSEHVSSDLQGSEAGLLGMAFHPDYSTNRLFFAYYNFVTNRETGEGLHDRLSRFETSPDNPHQGMVDSEVPLITQADKHRWHNAGDLHFGRDGYLYLTLGDEGGGYDPYRNSQRIDKDFFSGIIRLDVDKAPGSLEPNIHPAVHRNDDGRAYYGIPPDNPFVLATQFNGIPVDPRNVRTEFFAVGLRNPWRMSFDPLTGEAYVNDVGQADREEVNLLIRGGNYGWRSQEGTKSHPTLHEDSHTNAVFYPPLAEYDHSVGNSIAGSLVYRGNRYPELDGRYLFGDFWYGRVGAIRFGETHLASELNVLRSEIDAVRLRLQSPTPELEAAQRAWETNAAAWVALDPTLHFSAAGTEFIKGGDGTLLASTNSSPWTDTYFISTATELTNITSVRLEVLPHASLPNQGPGRYQPDHLVSGNFVLNEIELTAYPTSGTDSPIKLSLHQPKASFSQLLWDVSGAIDGDPETGWAVYPEIGKAHEASFELTSPAVFQSGTVLLFKLVQNHGQRATIGQLRLSVTDNPSPLERDRPGYIQAILDVPPEERTESDSLILASYYRAITPLLEPDRQLLKAYQEQIAGLLYEQQRSIEWIANNRGVSSFGVDPSTGDILMANWLHGRIEKLVSVPMEDENVPLLLSQTGAFSEITSLTPNQGIIPYEINAPFWSDHAHKSRWFSVPNTNQFLIFDVDQNWQFPVGTVWIKHFDIEMIRGIPDSRRRLETRFLVRTETGVYGLSYKWDEKQTDAELVSADGLTETIMIEEAGTIRPQVWRYPSRSECSQCHTEAAGFALGFNTPQLNRNTTAFGVSQNQISTLAQMGYFADALPQHDDQWPKLADVEDATATLTWRVRSYLYSNCVQCHQPGGSGRDSWDARLSVALESSGIIDGLPNDTLGIPDGRIVKPGVLDDSVLFKRISQMGSHHMPPLATTELNDQAIDLLAQWILLKAPSMAIGANVPPTIEIINPLEGAHYSDGTVLNIVIGATDKDDGVASVEIFGNGNSLGTLTNQPFELAWANIPEGAHTISAAATDNSGAVVNSHAIRFRVANDLQLRLDLPRSTEHGWAELRLTGPESATILVESSGNLEQWLPISTNQIRAGELRTAEALDVAKTNTFYRGSILVSPEGFPGEH